MKLTKFEPIVMQGMGLSYELAVVGNRKGIVYELINARTMAQCICEFLQMKKEITDQLFYHTLRQYFEGISDQELADNLKKIQVYGYFNMIYWNKVNKPEDLHMFDVCRRRLKDCLEEVEDLNLSNKDL